MQCSRQRADHNVLELRPPTDRECGWPRVSCRAMSASVSPGIFKAYDIRGIYGDEIDGAVAYAVGRAFARVIGTLAGKPVDRLRLGLGRDMRLTAPELAARYREGMTDEGAD